MDKPYALIYHNNCNKMKNKGENMKNIIAVCIETVHTYSLVKNIINSDKSLF